MATGQKISAQTVATSFDSTDIMTVVQAGINKSVTHDVLMDDTQICKAWVNFNGTGTVAIRDDFNVSSITDNGTGDYTANFTNALTDANYSGVISAGTGTSIVEIVSFSTTQARFETNNSVPTPTDREFVSVQFFGS